MYDYYECDGSTFVVYNTITKFEVCVCSDFDTNTVDKNGENVFSEDAEERAQMICNALNATVGK